MISFPSTTVSPSSSFSIFYVRDKFLTPISSASHLLTNYSISAPPRPVKPPRPLYEQTHMAPGPQKTRPPLDIREALPRRWQCDLKTETPLKLWQQMLSLTSSYWQSEVLTSPKMSLQQVVGCSLSQTKSPNTILQMNGSMHSHLQLLERLS